MDWFRTFFIQWVANRDKQGLIQDFNGYWYNRGLINGFSKDKVWFYGGVNVGLIKKGFSTNKGVLRLPLVSVYLRIK